MEALITAGADNPVGAGARVAAGGASALGVVSSGGGGRVVELPERVRRPSCHPAATPRPGLRSERGERGDERSLRIRARRATGVVDGGGSLLLVAVRGEQRGVVVNNPPLVTTHQPCGGRQRDRLVLATAAIGLVCPGGTRLQDRIRRGGSAFIDLEGRGPGAEHVNFTESVRAAHLIREVLVVLPGGIFRARGDPRVVES